MITLYVKSLGTVGSRCNALPLQVGPVVCRHVSAAD